ncbi:MAG: hypothetical protein HY730_02685 [Candidatus Tectomicrobia bacterium]|uniref:Uncharacterized protein n=1 Tax=Tectimicrobiota bacterium TaxID=2528274 RepID=A0A933GMH1_UNCTE|nr:hypothetical protein [Candidatus Tectomicrobia bacterium]
MNKQVAKGVRIKKFVCLHKEFDPDEADLTRTRKLKRIALAGKLKGLLEAIYNNEKKCFVEASVTYQDGREGRHKDGFECLFHKLMTNARGLEQILATENTELTER